MTRRILFLSLIAAVMTSALAIVTQRHESRKLFVTLQELREQKSELDREWGQLLLEQGTWATHGRVEHIAREKLNMTLPRGDVVYRIRS